MLVTKKSPHIQDKITRAFYLDDWLTVRRSVTLVDLQLDAQNSSLFTYDNLLKSSTCFEHYPAHLQEVYDVILQSDDTRGCICTVRT